MKIIIKPLGAVLLCAGVVTLAVLALRSNSPAASAVAPPITPVIAATTSAPKPLTDTSSTIYRDGFENGWDAQGWSWVKEVAYDDKKQTHQGSAVSIRARFVGYEGVKFHHAPLDMKKYDRLSFFVNGGETGGQKLQVGGESDDPNGGKAVPGVGVHLSALPAKQWRAVVVPLRDLQMEKRPTLSSFWVQGDTDKSQPAVFIDDVRLLAPGDPAPNGLLLPAPAP